MKIVVNTMQNKGIFTYLIGAGKKKLSLAPKSNITFQGDMAKEIFADKGALNAMKQNHTVLVSDDFVEKVETPVIAPVKDEVDTEELSAKEQLELIKGCESLEELAEIKEKITLHSAKIQFGKAVKRFEK